MRTLSSRLSVVLTVNTLLLSILTCHVLAPPRLIPTPMPPTPTPTSTSLSAQVTLVPHTRSETNQTPPYKINAQIPQLAGSDDPRVTAFNQRLGDLVKQEADTWRESFQQNTVIINGSSLDESYTLISQLGDLWSLKFDFHFYSDGAAHPGLYSITLNYDLGQGKELALDDLFIAGSHYLDSIASYCITELSKQPGFDSSFADGAKPTPENYKNWNVTPEGLLITFDMYQVAPGASGPIQVLVPYAQLKGVIDPHGPLAHVIR